MKSFGTIIILVMLTGMKCFSFCICSSDKIKKVRNQSIESSEYILTGRIIDIDSINRSYSLEIIDLYKGELLDKVKVVSMDSMYVSDCAFWPDLSYGDKYIIYANSGHAPNEIFISQCSATRSILNPQVHFSYFIQALNKKRKTKKRKAIKDFEAEIRTLEKLNRR